MLRPKLGILYLEFECPSCESVHNVSYEEVRKVGKIMCYCGKLLEFEPVTAQVTLYFGNTEVVKPITPPALKPKLPVIGAKRIHINDLVDCVSNLGFTRKEAKRRLDKVNLENKDEAEILREVLSVK